MDTTERNRELIRHIYAELAEGNGRPFVDNLADDVPWTIMGSTSWSRTYEGKQAVREELLRPLFAQFADTYTAQARRLIAEGDLVVAEVRGRVLTNAGKPYHNSYCFIFRIADGKVHELTEYQDTALLAEALEDPAPAANPAG
jgi:ketosteroid isomerase-like protein